MTTITHGGKREGSGAKPLPDQSRKRIKCKSYQVTELEEQWINIALNLTGHNTISSFTRDVVMGKVYDVIKLAVDQGDITKPLTPIKRPKDVNIKTSKE